jgi:hypothetical protein
LGSQDVINIEQCLYGIPDFGYGEDASRVQGGAEVGRFFDVSSG